MRCRTGLASLLFVLTSYAEVAAQVDIERFVPAFGPEGGFGVQGTATPGPMMYSMGLWTSWSKASLVVAPPETALVEHRFTSHFRAELGVGGRMGVAFDFPFTLYQDVDEPVARSTLGGLRNGGVGSPALSVRYRLLGEEASDRNVRREGFGLAAQGLVTLPAGDSDALVSEAGVTTLLRAATDFRIFDWGVGAQLGWKHRFEPVRLLGVRMRDELALDMALRFPLAFVRGLTGIAEVRIATDAGRPFFDSETTAVEGDLGARVAIDTWYFNAGVGTGFTSGVGMPSIRIFAGLQWVPRSDDADGDGIDDSEDECTYDPEDIDGFEDDDGCADLDNDGDLVMDQDDRCPDEAAEEFKDEDEDGCTDAFVDRDEDGIEDRYDACPNRKEDLDQDGDDDGCPE